MFAVIQPIRGVITAVTVLEADGIQVDIQAEVLYLQEFREKSGRGQTSRDIETGFMAEVRWGSRNDSHLRWRGDI